MPTPILNLLFNLKLKLKNTGVFIYWNAVFLYSNFSLTRRLIGHSIVYLGNQGIHKWSEINFKPFGYFFTEESEPADKSMCDISYFGNYKYDEQVKIKIITPYLKVSDSNIGMYY